MSAKYDKDGNVIESTDSAGNRVTSTYDEHGRRLTQTTYAVTENGTQERTTHYVYNAAGELIQTVDPDGNEKMSAAVDSKGRRTEYKYDQRGNVTNILYPDGTTEQFEYDTENRNTKTVSRTGLTTTYTYDKTGNLLKQTDARGNTVSYTYDSNYNLLTTTNEAGAVTTYAYDKLNRNTSVTDEEGNVTRFTYNALSLQTSVTDPKGNTTRYEYDGNGNRTKIIYPDGTETQCGYDARGRVIWKKDAEGRKTEYTYDSSDRLVSVKQPGGAATTYAYDKDGNLTAAEDPNGNVTQYEYDEAGRRTRVILPDGSRSTSSYDQYGKLVSTEDCNHVKTSYEYDEHDRVIREQAGNETTSYRYDAYGRLAAAKTGSSEITYTYNRYGELQQKTYENGEAVRYIRDRYGRTAEILVLHKDKELASTKYGYDKMNRLTRVIGRNGEATVYTYDANGNRETATFANGVKLTYTYDSCNRLITQKAVDRTGAVIAQYTYTVGKNGERTKTKETGAGGETETEYAYDAANRLVKETIRTGSQKTVYEYGYDQAGNRTSREKDGIKTTYTYDSRNRLTTEKTGDSEVAYYYDANGSLLKQSGWTDTIYTYDSRSRLTAYQQGQKKESYTYDAEGVRRSRTAGEATTYFVSDTSGGLAQTLAETDGRGTARAEYTRADSLTAQARGGRISYYLYDGHGDVRALLDEAGAVTDRYRYSAYGELTSKTGNTENHYLYTGEYYDGTSGLYYLRARYMNPSTGSFLTMDTYEGNISDPVTLHKYLYANGNPVMYNDPSGNMANLSEMSTTVACMGVLACMGMVYFNYQRSISDAGIVPGTCASIIEDIKTQLLEQGICTIRSVVDAIPAKIKGQVQIYEKSAMDAVEEMDKGKEMYYVYFLKKDDIGEIEYVGRTKHLMDRIKAHERSSNRSCLELASFVRMASYAACRAIEQAAMFGAHTLKGAKGEEYNNQINGVGVNNPKAGLYYKAANYVLETSDNMADYILNQTDNERLNQIERFIDLGLEKYRGTYCSNY